MGFKARKKLITRERVLCKDGKDGADDCGGVVCVCKEQRILDLLVESSISGEKSCGMIDQQT